MRTYTKDEILAMDPDARFKMAKNELKIPNCALMADNEVSNSILARLSQEGLLTTATGAPAPQGVAQAPQVAVGVRVVCTPYDQSFPDLVGRTVQQAMDSLKEAFNLEPSMRIYLNGDRVTNLQTRLESGHTLELTRAAGEKGR